MRVLVTNDDGVRAPGIAHLARAMSAWAGENDEVVVVAPLDNHSGGSAAIGRVYEREKVAYERVTIPGAEHLLAYGVDGSPALAAIVAVLGAFGPRPDVVVSGVNLGANVGRSILHSGTVGAALSAAQMGVRGMAVSLRFCDPPVPWESATTLATACLPAVFASEPGNVLNLNVPPVELGRILGIRRACIGPEGAPSAVSRVVDAPGSRTRTSRPAPAIGPRRLPDDDIERVGEIRLSVGGANVSHAYAASSPDPVGGGPVVATDTRLLSAGYATITMLEAVPEARSARAREAVLTALADAEGVMSRLPTETLAPS